jgi:hypothetical protein
MYLLCQASKKGQNFGTNFGKESHAFWLPLLLEWGAPLSLLLLEFLLTLSSCKVIGLVIVIFNISLCPWIPV